MSGKRGAGNAHQGSQSSQGGAHKATPSNSRDLGDVQVTNRAPDSTHPSRSRRRYVANAIVEPPVETMRTVSAVRFSATSRGIPTSSLSFQPATYYLRTFHGEWRVLFVNLSLFGPPINHIVSCRTGNLNNTERQAGVEKRVNMSRTRRGCQTGWKAYLMAP